LKPIETMVAWMYMDTGAGAMGFVRDASRADSMLLPLSTAVAVDLQPDRVIRQTPGATEVRSLIPGSDRGADLVQSMTDVQRQSPRPSNDSHGPAASVGQCGMSRIGEQAAVWGQRAALFGMNVSAAFFDGDAALEQPDVVRRILPFLPNTSARLLFTEDDRKRFTFGRLIAAPDAVFALGAGMIVVEYKSRRQLLAERWMFEIRLKDILQCVLAGLTVARTYRRTAANVLRYHNAAFLLAPERKVLETVWRLVPNACQYYGVKSVGASRLAQHCEARVRQLFPVPFDSRSAEGRLAHARLFRRAAAPHATGATK
jgi:hypothetical protein